MNVSDIVARPVQRTSLSAAQHTKSHFFSPALLVCLFGSVFGCSQDRKPSLEPKAIVSPLQVCTRLEALRQTAGGENTADESCVRRMHSAQNLDGPALWSMRSRCMTESQSLNEAYRCNRKHHPDWPAPSPNGALSAMPSPPKPKAPTTLCAAIGGDHPDVVRALVRDEAHIPCTLTGDPLLNGTVSPLQSAALSGDIETVRLLFEQGANPLATDERGRSAYVFAAMGNHQDILEFFWAKNAKPPKDDQYIGTVLWSAGLHGRQHILEHFANLGVDIDATHLGGWTALIGAAQSGHLDVVKWLVKHAGADLYRRSPLGTTAAQEAETHQRREVVAFLSALEQRP